MKLKDLKKTYLNEVSNKEELKNIKNQINLKKRLHFGQIFPYIFSTISVIVIVILLCIIFIDTAKVTFLSLAASSKVKQEMSLNVKETNNQVTDFDYYFTPDEEIVLSIELANPDQYEILSVEINNIKFTSYQFGSGSDIDTIYLNYKCQDTSGVEKLYINSIKYIDGTNIKECVYAGSREVSLAIAYPSPSIELLNITKNPNSISFNISDTDLIKYSSNSVVISLYEENIKIKDYYLDNTSYLFNDLKPGTSYLVVITGNFDLLDGLGLRNITLTNKEITTPLPFTYSLDIYSNGLVINTDYDLSLILNNNDYGKQVFGLEADTTYNISLKYNYNGEDYLTDLTIKTKDSNFLNVELTKLTESYLFKFNTLPNIKVNYLMVNSERIEVTSNGDLAYYAYIANSIIDEIIINYELWGGNYEEIIYQI